MNNLGKQDFWLRVNHQKIEDEHSRKTRSLVKGKPSKMEDEQSRKTRSLVKGKPPKDGR